MDTRNILISVKEMYAQQILRGRKRAELRKSFPAGKEGFRVYVYVPAPRKEIIGYFYVKKVNVLPVSSLWAVAGKWSSLSKEDFFEYFSGKECGVSIHFDTFIPLASILPLCIVKENYPEFHPPQSFLYLDKDVENLFLGNLPTLNFELK